MPSTSSVLIFAGLLAVALLCFAFGWFLARRSERAARACISLAVFGVILAAIPRFQPTLLHTALPLEVTIWIEGCLAVFPWMVLVGAIRAAEFMPHLRRVASLMVVLGIVYFLFGAVWMVLPDVDLGGRQAGRDANGVWMQSSPETCVAASCATALGYLGIDATEAEMIPVVRACVGRGSSLARAALGLRDELDGRYQVEVVDLSPVQVAQFARVDRPVLVVIRSAFAADHMVVVLGHIPAGVLVANPSPGGHGNAVPLNLEVPPGFGNEIYDAEDFIRMLRPGAIVFTPVG